jgi:hypothetical protein
MALYKHGQYLQQTSDAAFDKISEPGTAAPHPGIYRCEGCGREIGIANGHTLPPQSHHQHTQSQGSIRWRLIVYANGQPS